MTVRTDRIEVLYRSGLDELKAERYAGAVAALEPVVQSKPNFGAAHYPLARAYFFLGEIGQATKHLRKALRLGSDLETSRFLATIAAFDPAMNHSAVLACRKAFYATLRASSRMKRCELVSRLSPRKVLRIGYVSSFFDKDNWMKPVWGLIDHHNRERVEVHLFSDAFEPSVALRRARLTHARFHDISRLDNARAASLIVGNRIDILVDLNGYSKKERLPLLLAKPAPLMVGWFNIFGTTGMPCFDALIGDKWVIRANEERWYVEQVVKLPMSCLTFAVTYPAPRVQAPPCLRNGFITFGSLASRYKLNDPVIDAWAEIVRRCRRSRLILGNAALGNEGNRELTVRRFADRGVSAERLTFWGSAPYYEFLRLYDSIDIALDTFPYSGGTTTSDAIWQGVPVLTIAGDRWISRLSASILSNAGLEEFVCKDVGEYVEAAVRWGSSSDSGSKLKELRARMRSLLEKSPVCDCSSFADRMEDAYRSLWQAALERGRPHGRG